MNTALILELILALVTLGLKYKDASEVSEDEIDEALAIARDKFKLRDPNNLPDL